MVKTMEQKKRIEQAYDVVVGVLQDMHEHGVEEGALQEAVYLQMKVDTLVWYCNKERLLLLENGPDIDVAMVVRCRECKWYYTPNRSHQIYCNRSARIKMPEDGFCSFGKKKEGDDK